MRAVSDNPLYRLSFGERKRVRRFSNSDSACLTVGKEYQVYGIEIVQGFLRYIVIIDESYVNAPTGEMANCFEVIDARVSRHWVTSGESIISRSNSWLTICYPEWVQEPGYLERLYDDDPEALQNWLFWKEQLESEFGI